MRYLIISDAIVDAAGQSRKGETIVFDDPKQERRWVRRGVIKPKPKPKPKPVKAAAAKAAAAAPKDDV